MLYMLLYSCLSSRSGVLGDWHATVGINPSGLRRDPKTIQIKWQLVNQDTGEKLKPQVDECCQSSRLKSFSS